MEMNKIIKTILISLILVFITGFLSINSIQAAASGLEVEFEKTPLFSEANFLPGESILRYADVANNSEETKKIGLNITDNSGCSTDCLSDVLDLVVSENGNTLYSGSLSSFYGSGEKVLSDLNTGVTTKYYFSITFNPIAGNVYQNATANFDIQIGFFGEESISDELPGGGGGVVIISGLQIFDEIVNDIGETSVTITWDTNQKSTSRVIYSPCNIPHLLDPNNPPNYGYLYSTPECDTPAISNGVITNHTVQITDLLEGTTYCYRCVSHASPDTISIEHSFTTKAKETEKEEDEETMSKGSSENAGEWTESGGEDILIEGVEKTITQKEEPTIILTPEAVTSLLPSLLADIGDTFGNLGNACYINFPWWIILIFVIYPILLIIYSKEKKRRKEVKWISIFSVIIISILFIIWIFSECLSIWIILIAILIYLFIANFLKKNNYKQ